MARQTFQLKELLLLSLAPIIWGSTFLITTELLPAGYPITVATLRALPAGLLLLAVTRQLPSLKWINKILILGALNFSLFWICLFIAAYRLPGGIAATIGAIQPLIVIFLARGLLGMQIQLWTIAAAIIGLGGVALLVLTPKTQLDIVGVVAAVAGATSMAAGIVCSRKWQPETSLISFTAWQLIAGGLLLLPFALLLEPAFPPLTIESLSGLVYLSVIGAAFTYLLWFRGIAQIPPASVSMLSLLSPLTAILLGWGFLNQQLNNTQFIGVLIVLASVLLNGRPPRKALNRKLSSTLISKEL